MAFRKTFLSLGALLILGACSYVVESSNQNITFLTPEAQNAKCHVYIDKLKYQVLPPQTLNIKKSHKDMKVVCYAPGNRMVEIEVPSEFSKRSLWGTPAGVAWDYASSSLYYYPSVIAIDFTGKMLKSNSLPQYNNSDIKQPEEYDLEEFRASKPRLNSDKYKTEPQLYRRGESFMDEFFDEEEVFNENITEESLEDTSIENATDEFSVDEQLPSLDAIEIEIEQ